MKEIYKNIYVGNAMDAQSLIGDYDWAFVHCCKTFHQSMLGYRGSLLKTDPNYAFYRQGSRLALNLVDMDNFSKDYLDHYHKMFQTAIDFIDEQLLQNKKVLLHCDQGESRGPSIALLYMGSKIKFGSVEFEEAKEKFMAIYPNYSPKGCMYYNLKELWNIWCGGNVWISNDR